LTPQAVADILAVTRIRWPHIGVPAPIATLEQTNSRNDPRVQVADLVAGVGSWAAGQALAGTSPVTRLK
jgi:predicted RNA methylase